MKMNRRAFVKSMGATAVGIGMARGAIPQESGGGQSERLLVKNPALPAAADFDRLPLSWYKNTAQRLRDKARETGADAILLQNQWNLIYFTGLFHTTTERPFFALLPVKEDTLFWFHPGLDRDLVASWWCSGNEYYFDYLHAEGAYPNKEKLTPGKTVDLWEWILEGLKKKGLAEKAIAMDMEMPPSRMKAAKKVLPNARWMDIGQTCLRMRMIKTPEEIALTQRAMDYFSKIHAFARDLILAKGTDLTDFQVSCAANEYGTDLIMRDVKRDGRPHSAVGISVHIGCRTGAATAYPHPNQFFHKKIEKGDALQVSGGARIGGYGGECYRYYQILPWDSHQEKLWQVVTDCVHIQEQESAAGKICAEIAFKIHDYQVKNGVGKYVYHRPAHGEGMEGHQAPWLALGDRTVLEAGMMFSVEPGLYDPENGFGYNPSDNLLVSQNKGVLQSSVPYTREWMIIKL